MVNKTELEKNIDPDFTYHMMFRYSDLYAPEQGTIKIHQKVIDNHGSVWFAKFGNSIGRKTFDLIERQLKEKIPTFLFIVKKSSGMMQLHLGSVLQIKNQLKNTDIKSKFSPSYYHKHSGLISTAFKLNEISPLNPKILRVMEGYASKLPIINSLKSMSPLILARLKRKININDYKVV